MSFKGGGRGMTPLILASKFGHKDVVSVLLDYGADVEAKDIYRNLTAAWWASHNGHDDIVSLLRKHGATVNFLGLVLKKVLKEYS